MPGDKPYTPEEAIAQAIEAGNPGAALAKLKELGFELKAVEAEPDEEPSEGGNKNPFAKMRDETMAKVKAKHGDF